MKKTEKLQKVVNPSKNGKITEEIKKSEKEKDNKIYEHQIT